MGRSAGDGCICLRPRPITANYRMAYIEVESTAERGDLADAYRTTSASLTSIAMLAVNMLLITGDAVSDRARGDNAELGRRAVDLSSSSCGSRLASTGLAARQCQFLFLYTLCIAR